MIAKCYRCTVCNYIYDPRVGDPTAGIEPETLFEELPADWLCPRCGHGKEAFVPVPERVPNPRELDNL
ncbi:MAG: rubredoxin [Lentisphaeria bacterium]|jgi:rubredoxin